MKKTPALPGCSTHRVRFALDKILFPLEKTPQLFRTRRMPQLAQCLGLDLADALAGDIELLADFFQRVVGVHLDPETHAQHLRFARRERVEDVLADIARR